MMTNPSFICYNFCVQIHDVILTFLAVYIVCHIFGYKKNNRYSCMRTYNNNLPYNAVNYTLRDYS